MKYPVFFRILAVLTILTGLVGLFAFIICVVVGMQKIWFGQQHGTIIIGNAALWLLIAAFAWFFASRHSHIFLHTTFVSLLAVVILLSYTAFGLFRRQIYKEEQIALFVVAVILFVFGLLNLLGLFYQPIRSWVKQENKPQKIAPSLIIYSAFLLTIALSHAATWWIGKTWKREIIMYTTSNWQDADGNSHAYPMPLEEDGYIEISFSKSSEIEFDAIKIPVNADGRSKITDAKIDSDHATNQKLTFQQEGNFLVAHFPPIKSKSLRLYPRIQASSSKQVWLPGMTLLRHIPYFDLRSYSDFVSFPSVEEVPTDDGYIAEEEGEEEEEEELDLIPRFSELVLGFSDSDTSQNRHYFNQGDIFFTDTDYGFGSFTGSPYSIRNFGFNAMKRYLKRISVDDSDTSGYDTQFNNLFKELAGMNAFVEEEQGDGNTHYFSYVNPMAAKWVSIHLIPDPDTKIRGYKAAEVYDKIFRRLCRLMVLTHEYVIHEVDFEQEKSAYQEAMQVQEFDGYTWLNDRYANALKDHYDGESWSQRPSLLIGFWLRRSIDTSEDELWSGLKRVMYMYDPEWSQENIRVDGEDM